MGPVPLDDGGHVWQWGDRVLVLADEDQPTPLMVCAAILAIRDATTPEHEDVAAVLVWTVEEHPPWDGPCPNCGTPDLCDDQKRAHGLALEFLITKSTEIVRRSRQRLARLDPQGAITEGKAA